MHRYTTRAPSIRPDRSQEDSAKPAATTALRRTSRGEVRVRSQSDPENSGGPGPCKPANCHKAARAAILRTISAKLQPRPFRPTPLVRQLEPARNERRTQIAFGKDTLLALAAKSASNRPKIESDLRRQPIRSFWRIKAR
jgi:hypothetical protein